MFPIHIHYIRLGILFNDLFSCVNYLRPVLNFCQSINIDLSVNIPTLNKVVWMGFRSKNVPSRIILTKYSNFKFVYLKWVNSLCLKEFIFHIKQRAEQRIPNP